MQPRESDADRDPHGSSPEMTVGEALEEIAARGSGAWMLRCVMALSFSSIVISLESGVSAYAVSCVQADWDTTTAQMASLASANSAGQVLGSLILTPFTDTHGRRQCLIYFSMSITLFAFLQAFAPSLSLLILCRFVLGFTQAPMRSSVAYLAEVLPSASRGRALSYAFGVAWGVGSLSVNALAYFVLPHYGWRVFVAITAIPFIISVWLLYRLVESPRWLMSTGQTDEALASLAFIAQIDGTTLPCQTLVQEGGEFNHAMGEVRNSCFSIGSRVLQEYGLLFSRTSTLLLVCLTATWICTDFAYKSIVIYEGAILGVQGKPAEAPCQFDYGFLIAASAPEVLATLAIIPLIDRPDLSFGGRNGVQVAGYLLSAITIILAGFEVWPVTLYAGAARALYVGAASATGIQVAEVLDVSVRGTGSGFVNSAGLMGSTLASFWVFAPYSQGVIALGIGAAMVSIHLFLFGIPETALHELGTPTEQETGQNSARSLKALKKGLWHNV